MKTLTQKTKIQHVIVALLLFVSYGCNSFIFKVSEKRKNDIVYNSGFITDIDSMLRKSNEEFSIYNFKSNETIADIGFSTGWLEGIILAHYDSLTIYAEDIDSYSIKRMNIRMDKYLELRQKPNSNKLFVVKGHKSKTTLPANTFDKIIIRETFHHFNRPNEMLTDINRILKSTGLLFIYEPITEKTFYDKNDKAINYCREDILSFFEKNKFKLLHEYELMGNPGNVPPWFVVKKEDVVPKKIYVFSK